MQENKMGTMPVGKLLANMGIPMMASMMFQALYNVVDSIFVAKLGQDAMNAVSLAFPMQSLMIALSTGTGVGMNALISRSLGQKNPKAANDAANTGLALYAVYAVFFAILGLTVVKPFFRFQTGNETIIRYGSDYLSVVLCLSAALMAQMSSEKLLQSTGRTDLAMIPQITGAVLNMCLDPVMIFGLLGCPRMEVKGAAVATIIGQSVGAVLGFTLNVKKNHELRLSLKEIRFRRSVVGEIYRIGLPSIVMQAIGSAMTFTLNKILIGFTEAATAVFGAYYKLQSFIFMPVFGLNNAMVPIVSYNYGAGNRERVRETVKKAILVAIVIMCVGTVLFEVIPEVLLGFFSPTEEMLSVGRVAFRIIGVHFPVAGFCIVSGSACQALRKPEYTLITSICRQLVVLLPVAWLLSLTGVLNYVWLAFPIAEVMSLIMSAIFLRRTYRVSGIAG